MVCDCGFLCMSEAANVKTKCMANHKITQISTRKYGEVRYIKLTNLVVSLLNVVRYK